MHCTRLCCVESIKAIKENIVIAKDEDRFAYSPHNIQERIQLDSFQ